MGLKILHLSDLHIGEEKEPFGDMTGFADCVIHAETGPPDVILVTGDIFNGADFEKDTYDELI